jgi:sigma-B regulation protein RsbU (phosphoserine phosphatase)
MTLSDLEHFKNLLIEREQNLSHWLESPGSPNEGDIRKAQVLLTQIKAGLQRVENHTYGVCTCCKEGVELYRLEVQPVAEVCLGCISKQEQERLEEELFLASKIHRALLPQTIQKMPGFDLGVKSLAAGTVGGDYYDFLSSDSNRAMRVVIADTMGKGIPASLLMSNVQGALRILAEDIQSPQQLVTRLNQWLCHNVPVTKFVSLTYIAVQSQIGSGRGSLVYTNAGHCPPILVRFNGSIERLEPTGGVLGVHDGFTYEERSLDLSEGDLLVLYTDGVTEAESFHGEAFGEDRLIGFVRNRSRDSLDDLLNGLLDEVRFFSERPELADDVTIIAMRKMKP